MKTPTKEQIEELCIHLCFNCENDFSCDGHCYKCETKHWKKFRWQVKETVRRWEELKSIDTEVKEIVGKIRSYSMETPVEYNAGKKKEKELRIAIYETTEKIIEGGYGDFYNTLTRKAAIERMALAINQETLNRVSTPEKIAKAALEALLCCK